jgi:hypothetical protein
MRTVPARKTIIEVLELVLAVSMIVFAAWLSLR